MGLLFACFGRLTSSTGDTRRAADLTASSALAAVAHGSLQRADIRLESAASSTIACFSHS
jgi:hypothetical protein